MVKTESRSLSDSGRVDVAVLATVAFLACGVVANLIGGKNWTNQHSVQGASIHESNQALLNEMRSRLLAAVDLYENDAQGLRVWSRLQFPDHATPLSSCRLPRRIGVGTFAPDAPLTKHTGNALALVEMQQSHTVKVASGVSRDFDVYRIVAYYPSARDGGLQPGRVDGLEFCRFVSVPMVSADALRAISAGSDRQSFSRSLRESAGQRPAIVHALDLRSGRVFRLSGAGGLAAGDPAGKPAGDPAGEAAGLVEFVGALPADPERSNFALLDQSSRRLSLASNHAHPSFGVGWLGRRDLENEFPQGFELQIAGSAAARQVMLHLTLVVEGAKRFLVNSDIRTVAVAQDR